MLFDYSLQLHRQTVSRNFFFFFFFDMAFFCVFGVLLYAFIPSNAILNASISVYFFVKDLNSPFMHFLNFFYGQRGWAHEETKYIVSVFCYGNIKIFYKIFPLKCSNNS